MVILAHVDGDQQRRRDELVVALPGVAPSRGGDDYAVDVAIVGGVQQPGRPAEDVDGEVMAAQQSVRAEARDPTFRRSQDRYQAVAVNTAGEMPSRRRMVR